MELATIRGWPHRTPDTGHRTPDTGHRTPDTGHRTPDTGHRSPGAPVFGLSPDWLLHDGRPLAAATVLSHPEQLGRLRAACPEAAGTAVLAGDPCYDRILAALPYRDRFRRALGVAPGQRLVVVNSTWSPGSLFGDDDSEGDLLPSLLPRLAAELPADEYRTAAVLHPNIWHGHGPGQIRAWLDRARRAGLALVDPLEDWRQALIAADCVIGDHGSVTYYAAAIGRPVLLGAFPGGALDPDSPVAALGRTAPRLRPYDGLRAQIDHAVDHYEPGRYRAQAEHVSSAPGRSAGLLRRAFYDLIGIPEPAGRPALLDPLRLPSYAPAERTAPVHVLTRLTDASGPPEIAVVRCAADDGPAGEDFGDDDFGDDGSGDGIGWDAHTSVHEDTPDPGRLRIADVIVRYGAADDPRVGPPAAWAAEVLGRHPGCGLAVYVTGPGHCTVRTRGGDLLHLTARPAPDGRPDLCDPAAHASALHAWLAGGKSPEEAVSSGITVVTGRVHHRVDVERAD
ncbi:hypothetical protein [Streptomyces sp. NPDC008001]|uniref:hypothetical protein n=1 Tax=Streptomyces sp. NPDC008001 TaxID=3364804 RepID=UPI0036F114C4